MVLATVLCSALAIAALAAGQPQPNATAAYVALQGPDLTLMRSSAVAGGPVRFNGVDIVALHGSIEAGASLLTTRHNVSSPAQATRPELPRHRQRFVGRNGPNIVLNSDAGGRVLVDNFDVAHGAWVLRGAVDAIKFSWLGSSALLPGAAGEPPPLPSRRPELPFLLLLPPRTSSEPP